MTAWLCAMTAAAGCAATGDAMGTVTVNLTGQGDSGAVYRLRDAAIAVTGPGSTQMWNTEDDPDRASLSADVAVGDYSALLLDGWRIERLDGAGAVTVPAALVSANPALFTVIAQHRTAVALKFRVGDDAVDLTQGYDITIGVQDSPLLAIINASGQFPQNVELFRSTAAGNAAPLRTIIGLATQLGVPEGIAVTGGQLIVADAQPPAIHVYPAIADGDVPPIREITGVTSANSGAPLDLDVAGGEIYVLVGQDIQVFPLGASGHVAPTRSIQHIDGPQRLAFDQGELYVARINSQSLLGVAVYPAMGSGDQPPTRTIVTANPAMCPSGIAVQGDLIYVTDICNTRVVVLPKGASGTVEPVRVIAGPSTGLHVPARVTTFGGELYVVDGGSSFGPNSVLVYPIDASGDAPPSRTITGSAIQWPLDLTVF